VLICVRGCGLIRDKYARMLQSVSLIWQAKFAYGGSILGSIQFTLLPQLPLKIMLDF